MNTADSRCCFSCTIIFLYFQLQWNTEIQLVIPNGFYVRLHFNDKNYKNHLTIHHINQCDRMNTKNYAFFFLIENAVHSPLMNLTSFSLLVFNLVFIKLYGKICFNSWSCLFCFLDGNKYNCAILFPLVVL